MKLAFVRRALTAGLLTACLSAGSVSAAVQFLGTGAIPGTATDNSGLTRILEDGVTPENRIGGLGSAIAYTGFGNFYLATPDRGPADGATTYKDRAYLMRIALQPNPANPGHFLVTPTVLDTWLLRLTHSRVFTGSNAAFDATNSDSGRRFDPEGIRAAGCEGRFYVSDEYGPFLYQFFPGGRRSRSVPIPNKFLADLPSANPTDELAKNLFGRQANRGMEGLAISPDGETLFGIMQSPLLQDGGLDSNLSRVGTNSRIVQVDVDSGAIREFLYPLENRSFGVSEIVAVNDHELLVLERDGRAGANAAFKRIFRIDLQDATDIRDVKQLPITGIPADIVPVEKTAFMDLLDPAFGLAGPSFPEKIEGLAFGPDLADGRHLLIVSTDNDFSSSQPSLFYAFAVQPSDLPGYEAQEIRIGSCHPHHN
jgi:hypothetical protein